MPSKRKNADEAASQERRVKRRSTQVAHQSGQAAVQTTSNRTRTKFVSSTGRNLHSGKEHKHKGSLSSSSGGRHQTQSRRSVSGARIDISKDADGSRPGRRDKLQGDTDDLDEDDSDDHNEEINTGEDASDNDAPLRAGRRRSSGVHKGRSTTRDKFCESQPLGRRGKRPLVDASLTTIENIGVDDPNNDRACFIKGKLGEIHKYADPAS